MLQYASYIERLEKGEVKDQFGNVIKGGNQAYLVKPIINFYTGEKYCALYRNFLSDLAKLKERPLQESIHEAAILMADGGFKFTNRPKEEQEEAIEKGKKKERRRGGHKR